ncbi:MAG: terminase family protein [Actinomycetota bacterium]
MATAVELRAKLAAVRRLRDAEEHNWDVLSRPAQREPEGEWGIWILSGGRGGGKSRALSEALRRRVRLGISRESAIVGATAADARDVMIEGPAGVLACCTEAERPRYEPSKRRLQWPNGAVSHVYSADEPERLRGPQHDFAIGDELRAWRYLEESIDNLLLGLRMGDDPRGAFATTPSGRPELRALLERPGTVVTRASTYDNLANMAPAFRERVVDFYEGSRLARAELHGEFLDDVEGALFERRWLEENRVEQPPHPADIRRTVVALDPADGVGAGAEQALCAACITVQGHVYILRSAGERSSPLQWLKHALRVASELGATIVVEDTGYGRPLLELLDQASKESGIVVPWQAVHAAQSKRLRGQDAAVLAERGRLHFLGRHDLLEDQLCTWVEGDKSPDRLDAMAHCVRELVRGGIGGGRVQGRAVPWVERAVPDGAVPWEGVPIGGIFAAGEERRVVVAERDRSDQAAWLELWRS